MTGQDKSYLRRDDAAAYIRQKHKINCTAGYLAKLASVGGGPIFHRLHNRWALYTETDLDVWALSRISGPLRKASDEPSAENGPPTTLGSHFEATMMTTRLEPLRAVVRNSCDDVDDPN